MEKSESKNGSKNGIGASSQKADNKGGQTTIRPPAKISKSPQKKLKILCSGVDTLYLSLDVFWKDLSFFDRLTQAKALASSKEKDICFPVTLKKFKKGYKFNIRYYGAQGYEWLLYNGDYSLRIGNWPKPQCRPSIRIQFHSETLWLSGLKKSISFILRLIRECGGTIAEVKISRLDLCIDTLFPDDLWSKKLIDQSVTRANHSGMYFNNKQLTGITFGKGRIHARFYDKPLEINQKSKKTWFYDQVWKIDKAPDGYKIIRIEFQLTREIIRELGIDKLGHLYRLSHNAWAYCTTNWLKFQNNPNKQSHQRETYLWWKTIQNGFTMTTLVNDPLIRCKCSNPTKESLFNLSYGSMSSLMAVEIESGKDLLPHEVSIYNAVHSYIDNISEFGKTDTLFQESVFNKRAKYQKLHEKYADAMKKRKNLGFI